MPTHLERELEKLKRKILSLSAIVEDRLYKAVKSVVERKESLALALIGTDSEIHEAHIDIDEECLKILALYRPAANVLRFIISLLKICNDLSRIADLSANIASRAKYICRQVKPKHPYDFYPMAETVKEMLRISIQAFVEQNTTYAREVMEKDLKVDEMNRAAFREIQEAMKLHMEDLESLMHHLSVSRNLERIADHSANIAKGVVYLLEGELVRSPERG